MNTDIHRLLDEAFEGVEMTPDSRDLKEEIRANLMARTAELEDEGLSPAAAARRAVDELGPIGELVSAPLAAEAAVADPYERNRVRQRPAFVVRVTLLSVAAGAAIVLALLAGLGTIGGGAAAVLGLGLGAAAALGWVTADALHQETTSSYAMPLGRAAGYGLATFAAIGALAAGAAFATESTSVASIVAAGGLLLASVGLYAWLGASQTNVRKEWVLQAEGEFMADGTPRADRFQRDPAAAARFGIYTAVLWTVGVALAIGLAIALAWWWSLIVLAACVAFMMIMLARMLFGPAAEPPATQA